AAARFSSYDRDSVQSIVAAVARAGSEHATALAKATVEETGFGLIEDKATKNRIASLGIAEHYAMDDFVTPRVDATRRVVQISKPAGVIFALIPSTNPVSTLYFKVILALMTRNAIVISPHPGARQVCIEACAILRSVALQAGAPPGTIQIV